MLNKDKQRELAYVAKVDEIKPIEGKDRVECAVVNGWTIMVRKNQFKPGDLGIYFEIDSKVPPRKEFEFLAPKKYKIKTQKYGSFYSQGLLMHPNDFGWTCNGNLIIDNNGNTHCIDDESKFLTKTLGVKYAVVEDNQRKSSNNQSAYNKMAYRHSKLFAKQPFKWLMTKAWGKKLLFTFFGKKRDLQDWPEWVTKTDEERIENMTWILENKNPWIATEKIDGTSTTFSMKREKFGKYEFYICSRNVDCSYGSNVYSEIAEKYNIEAHMKDMLGVHPEWDWVTIQGETYGKGIQKNTYNKKDHNFAAFNLVTSDRGRWDTLSMRRFLHDGYKIPCVPVLATNYILPDTVEELRAYVHSAPSVVDNSFDPQLKEGIVFRDLDGQRSFKCVDPDYLIKHHI